VFNKNKDFYDFYRSIQAYRNSINGKEDILVLDPNTEFFKYLQPKSKK
jgi:membrane protease subunit HflC